MLGEAEGFIPVEVYVHDPVAGLSPEAAEVVAFLKESLKSLWSYP
jgi:hypothetical protein